jgi:F0F1-type ATP synthase delta subunit
LKEVESELTKVKSYISKNADVLKFLANPTIDRESKKKMVDALFAKQKYSDLTVNLFRVLADFGRLDNTMKVINSFEHLMREYNSIVSIKIISNRVNMYQASNSSNLSLLCSPFLLKFKPNWKD